MPRLPRHAGNTQTLACLSLVLFVRAEDALHTPLSLFLRPCFDPVLNCTGRALCTHVWCCMCLVYGEYICSTLLRRRRCQPHITKRFLWFRVDRRGDSVVRGERNVWQTSRVSASLSKEANALLFKILYLCNFNYAKKITNSDYNQWIPSLF